MCGRLACTLCPSEIESKCQYTNKNKELEKPKWIESQYEYKVYYNGPPTTTVAVLSSSHNFPDKIKQLPEYCLIPMRWGMMPSHNNNSSANFHTHNARLENVLNSPMYKPCLMSGKRCVILADGYYEWQTTQGENFKQPYFLYQEHTGAHSEDKQLMKFAGLFNITRDDMGAKYSCTMLTKEADSALTWMHHRMPIILNTDEDVTNWLNYKEIKYDEALKMLPDYSKFEKKFLLKHYPVSKTFVNNTSCNEKKCMEKTTAKRKSSTLDGWLKKAKK